MKKLNLEKEREFLAGISRQASDHSIMNYIIPEKDFLNIAIGKKGIMDEESQKLLIQVYTTLKNKLKLSDSENGALNKIRNSIGRGKDLSPAEHRNQIFHAASELGIRIFFSSLMNRFLNWLN